MKCDICGRETDSITPIDIEDFEYRKICNKCRTKKIDDLIYDAEIKQIYYDEAAAVSWRANEELKKELEKKVKRRQ